MFLPLCLLLVLGLMRPVSSFSYKITARPGDNVTLACVAPIVNATLGLAVIKHVCAGPEYICRKPDAVKGLNVECIWVFDVPMEGGYVPVDIKNVLSTAIYECRFTFEMVADSNGKTKWETTSSYIYLNVSDQAAEGQDGRGDFSNKDGGNEDKGKDEDLSNEDGVTVSGLSNPKALAFIVPFIVIVVAVVVFMIFRKRKRQAKNVGQPPTEGVNETPV